jgi:alanyl-tRNA synthetase
LSNTNEAGAFVIVEETAVAKGIRRVSGITGSDATDAIQRAVVLDQECQAVLKSIKSAGPGARASQLEGQVNGLRAKLEEAIISQATKVRLRSQIEGFQKDLAGLKNKELMIMVEEGIAKVRERAIDLEQKGEKIAVFSMEIGSDAKAIKRSIEEIKKVARSLSFLCISSDTDKLSVFAYVSGDARAAGVKANEWVSKTLQACGGKGGGKEDLAQGSGPQVDNLQNAISEAKKYAASMKV